MGLLVLSWGQTEGIHEPPSFHPDLYLQSEPWLWHKPNNPHSALDCSVLTEYNLPTLNHWGPQKMTGGRGIKGGQNMDGNNTVKREEVWKCEKYEKKLIQDHSAPLMRKDQRTGSFITWCFWEKRIICVYRWTSINTLRGVIIGLLHGSKAPSVLSTLPEARSIFLRSLWLAALTAMRPNKGLAFQPTLPRMKQTTTPSWCLVSSLPFLFTPLCPCLVCVCLYSSRPLPVFCSSS